MKLEYIRVVEEWMFTARILNSCGRVGEEIKPNLSVFSLRSFSGKRVILNAQSK